MIRFEPEFWFYLVDLEIKEQEKKKKTSNTKTIFSVLSSIVFQMVSLGFEEVNMGVFCKKLSQKYDFNQEEINITEEVIRKCLSQKLQVPISQKLVENESFQSMLSDTKKPVRHIPVSKSKKFTLFRKKHSKSSSQSKIVVDN